MRPLYIFDLDGTLADINHRRHILDDKTDSHRWDRFEKACVHDEPNPPVVNILYALKSLSPVDVWVFSGRTEGVRRETVQWLWTHTPLAGDRDTLMMRPIGDSRPDDVLKQEFLDRMLIVDRERLVAVFDDRDKVVAMWRRNGIACFQVAPGNF